MLATYYPLWFSVMIWALVLIPVYPGLMVCFVAFIKAVRGRKGGGRLAIIGGILLLLGAAIVA